MEVNPKISDISENGGKGQLYGGGPGDEFHPVRREPRHLLAGGGAGGDAAGAQPRRRDTHSGRTGADAVL